MSTAAAIEIELCFFFLQPVKFVKHCKYAIFVGCIPIARHICPAPPIVIEKKNPARIALRKPTPQSVHFDFSPANEGQEGARTSSFHVVGILMFYAWRWKDFDNEPRVYSLSAFIARVFMSHLGEEVYSVCVCRRCYASIN